MTSQRAIKAKTLKSHAKAKRCLKLFERGHDMVDIAVMCNIPIGSVHKRIQLGRRLVEAGL